MKPDQLAIDACDPRSLVEAGFTSIVDRTSIEKLNNHLQVTIKDHLLIYDLNPAVPTLIDELDEAEKLFDANKFVEMGFKLSYCDEKKEFDINGEIIEERYIQKSLEQSPFRNLIFERRGGYLRRIFRKFTSRDIYVA